MASLSPEGCFRRRQRLLHLLDSLRLDVAVVTDVRDIYYFTGVLLPNDLPAVLLIEASNASTLIGPMERDLSWQGSSIPYAWNRRGTRDADVAESMAPILRGALAGRRWNSVGVQKNALLASVEDAFLAISPTRTAAVDADLREMQRRKDPDEIAVIRASIQANLGAYAEVCAAIRPGVSELEVLAAGYRGAMKAAGEKVLHDGDYQCGQINGPARRRPIRAGELYIVDAWTCFRGYWSDMSRTYHVGQSPSDDQWELFNHIHWVQCETRKLLKPGVDGRTICDAMDAMIRQHPRLTAVGLTHHGGHAIGLRGHEMPDVNSDRGGVLEPGQVICIEPGGYFAEARIGVRLENMYLITDDGCEDLCPDEIVLYECG